MSNFVRYFFVFILIAVMASHFAQAATLRRNAGEPLKAIAGKVVKIKMNINRLYVEDEFSGGTFDFFVHENELAKLAVGERVRVYYHSLRMPALRVEKMTVLEYNEKNQNQGYLYRKD